MAEQIGRTAQTEIEYELTYLASKVPEGIQAYDHVEIEDVYFPATDPHPKLRIRRKDDIYELTKKTQVHSDDAGVQEEANIPLTADEFRDLALRSERRLLKTRYFVPYRELTAEIDIFGGLLQGLVLVEFEFDNAEARDTFSMPDFCLVDVTQDDFIAGGVLSGKSYADIEPRLTAYNYRPL